MKVSILFVLIIFLLFSSLFTFSLCKHDDNDDYDIKVNTKVKDQGDEITVKVIIKNNHNHEHHKELDDIEDDKANRCKGFNINNNGSDDGSDSLDIEVGSSGDISNDNNGENEKNEENAKRLHNHGHHHHHDGRDICGCKFGRYGKDCRKRELEYQNSFIQWSNQFNRTYRADQFLLKYEAFKDSSRFIEQYKRENQNSTMELGLTQFSDMTHDEFLHVYTSKLFEFNSNETTPSNSLCSVNITQNIVNSWNDGNQDFIQVAVIISNIGPTTIRSFSFKLNNIISIWEVETLSGSNNYQLPNWVGSISSGSSHTFGYIQQSNQTTPLIDETSTCDELPTPTPTTPISSCNANVSQTITNSWRENNQDYIQVETIITNIGQSIIQSYTFQLNDIISIWEVQTLSNNTFALPNWKNSIEIGSSHTFGYIQKSYLINPLLSVNKVCQESSSNITTDNKPPKSGLLKWSRPASIDWRTWGMVNKVKNQGGCGSCYTFSAVGALESHYFRKYNTMLDLSEQNLVDCTSKYGNGGCSGGWMHNCFKYILENGGINQQHNYLYEARVGQCRYNSRDAQSRLSKYVMIPRDDEEALADAVASVGPVSVAYDASTREFMYYQGGIYHSENCDKFRTTHAVVVVGYGTESGVPYWTIKNSWGEAWGEKGYFRMRRNTNNKCGVVCDRFALHDEIGVVGVGVGNSSHVEVSSMSGIAVDSLNNTRENQNSTMELGLTQFSDMTHDEFLHVYTSKLFEFNSNETTPSNSLCSVNITQNIVNSWNDGNQDFIQVAVIITNIGPTTIRSFSFKLNNIISIWEVEALSGSNNYQLPNWVGSISSGSSHTFGYIQQSNQTTQLIDETSTCDELPTPTPTTPISSCNANLSQTITNSWRENNQDYIQVETIITNIGQSIIQSYTFQLNDIISIWEVQTLSNNTFALPNWKNSIEVGTSHTFGYIQKSYLINPLLSINKRPDSIDWRTWGMVNKVKNQGGCGSCYAVGALKSHYFRKYNTMLDLSEQNLVD
ncbi:hypothetical protein ACTFIZ_002783 [Dictyostelium cf. discoideum]